MAITVQHSPSAYLTGVGAYGAGVANYQQKVYQTKDAQAFELEQQQRQIQAAQQQQLVALQAQFAQQAASQQQQQQMAEFQRQAQLEQMEAQAYYGAEKLWQIQSAKEQQVQYKYTEGQKQKQQQLMESYGYLDQSLATGEISDYQAEQMKRQLDAEFMGIRKMPTSGQNRYPEGTEPGKVFYFDKQSQGFTGQPPVEDGQRPIPLVRDAETGNVEIMRNWQYSDKAETQAAKFEQRQAAIAEQNQSKMDIAQERLKLEGERIQISKESLDARTDQSVKIATARASIAADLLKANRFLEGGVPNPKYGMNEAMRDAAGLLPDIGAQPPGVPQPPQPGMGQQQQGSSLPFTVPDGLLVHIDPETGQGYVDSSALESLSTQAADEMRKWDAMFMDAGYIDGSNAIRGLAWIAADVGEWDNPMKLPVEYREPAIQMERIVNMSGIGEFSNPKPNGPLDRNAIPPGTPYIDPNGVRRIKPGAQIAGPAQGIQ